MQSNLFMYLAAMSAVTIHNLANNIKDVTHGHNFIDLKTQNSLGYTLDNSEQIHLLYPQCNGSRQSPIRITTKSTKDNLNLRLGLTAYERPMSGFLVNQFPTFRLIPFSYEWPRPSALVSQTLARSFNPYADSHFSLSHVEFYWNQENDIVDTNGFSQAGIRKDHKYTELLHTLDGIHYPLEINFVHKNTAYNSLDEANLKPDGLLIFAVLVVPSTHESYIFDKILDDLTNLTDHQKQTSFSEDSTWRSLLPQDTSRFYRYFGSTLLPPCHESVQWIVFDEKLKLGQKQLKRLKKYRFLERDLNTGKQIDWSMQRRAPRDIKGRLVERSFRLESPKGAEAASPVTVRSNNVYRNQQRT